MSLAKEKEEINLKIAQLKFIIDNKLISNNYKLIFQKLNDINKKTAATSYLKAKNAQTIGCTALHFALENEDLEILDILLKHGADFTLANDSDSTALHLAIEEICSDVGDLKTHFSSEFANTILTAHVNYKNFRNPSDQNGFSHFHAACMMNHTELVELFLVNEVDVHGAVKKSSPRFPGYTPLHLAANFFAVETLEALLEFGADVHLKNAQGYTPIHLLLRKSVEYVQGAGNDRLTFDKQVEKSNMNKMMTLFIQNMDEDGVIFTDRYGFSQLHFISTTQDRQIVERFLKSGINIDHCVHSDSPLFPGYTALHFAAYFSLRTVRMLVKNGASMNIKNAEGLTPFDICLEMYGDKDILKILSIHPPWKNITFHSIEKKLLNIESHPTPLKLVDFVLAMSDIERFAKIFQINGIDANMCIPMDSTLWPGYTPLHIAVLLSKNSIEKTTLIINELYRNGADLNCQDIRGRTALNIAFRQEKFETAELLLSLCRRCEPVNIVDDENLSHLHVLTYISTFEDSARKLMLSMLNRIVDIDIAYRGEFALSCIAPGSSALHVAMKTSCDWEYVPKILLAHGADAMARASNGMTPIHVALTRKDEDTEFAEKVLSTSSLKDCVVDNFQLSHLHVACYANDKAAVEKLIEEGADVNRAVMCQNEIDSCLHKYDGFTPLRFATMNDNPQIAIALLVHGANILAREPNGMTPLYAALKDDLPRILQPFGLKRNIFLFALTCELNWQRQMLFEDGVTMLHVAVCCSDIEIILNLLDKGAVNDQIFSDSPLWPGFTALHVLVTYDEQRHSRYTNFDDEGTPGDILILKLLLGANADVTLRNSARDTPLHTISKEWTTNADDTICTFRKRAWLRMLLQAHEDFDVNLANSQGLSFLHLACALGEVSIVENFLQRRQIDVNKRIDCFSEIAPGCTPLHLVMRVKNMQRSDIYSQLEVVDMLLKYGADANAEDVCGNTPLHYAVKNYYTVCDDFVERIIRGGADVNKRNIKGETAIELLLTHEKVEVDKIKQLLRYGCSWNASNSVSGKNLWALALSSTSFEAVKDLIFLSSINFPSLLNEDEEGRIIIHHVVSIDTVSQWESDDSIAYKRLIQEILEKECDVDDQDKLGRTPLHFAAKHFNHYGISALLDAGADINILDSSGHTALSSAFANSEETLGKIVYATAELLVMHVEQLLFCGLFVNPINRRVVQKICDKLPIKQSIHAVFQKDHMEISQVEVGLDSLTLNDFLFDQGILSYCHTMLEIHWDIIDNFFTTDNWYSYRKHNIVAKFVLLQYRKANARVQQFRQADYSISFSTEEL